MIALFLACYFTGFFMTFDDAARCFRSDPDRLGAFIACAVLGLFWHGVLLEETILSLAQVFHGSRRQREDPPGA